MTKRQLQRVIEMVGFLFQAAEDNSEIETAASTLLTLLWEAHDEADG